MDDVIGIASSSFLKSQNQKDGGLLLVVSGFDLSARLQAFNCQALNCFYFQIRLNNVGVAKMFKLIW